MYGYVSLEASMLSCQLPLVLNIGLSPVEWDKGEGFEVALIGSMVSCGENGDPALTLLSSNSSNLSNLACCISVLLRCWLSIVLNRVSNMLISFFVRPRSDDSVWMLAFISGMVAAAMVCNSCWMAIICSWIEDNSKFGGIMGVGWVVRLGWVGRWGVRLTTVLYRFA